MKKLLLLLCFFSLISAAQQKAEFINYNSQNSLLPSDIIYCIFIDHEDNKWIGTDNGLVKICGNKWTIYNTSNGLMHNRVTGVAEDSQNNIWITDSVLSKFENSKWIHFTPDKYPNASINSLMLAIDDNNIKWMTTQNGWYRDVCCFNDTAFFITDWSNAYELRWVKKIKIYKNEKWILGNMGLWKYVDTGSIKPGYGFPESIFGPQNIYDFCTNSKGDKLFSSYYEKGTADAMWLVNELWEIPDHSIIKKVDGLSIDYFMAVAYENDSIKWISSNYKLYKLSGKEIISYQDGFKVYTPGTILVDKSGNKWMVGNYDECDFGVTVFNENGLPLSIAQSPENPSDFYLSQNYPNPFNPETTIEYHIPKAGYVNISIFNVLGKEVTNLTGKYQEAGSHKAIFNGAKLNLSSGVYFYRLKFDHFEQYKKMIYIK